MNTERSLETKRGPIAALPRRFGARGLIAAAGAVLLLSGCVAYERVDHYHHGRPGAGPHYKHFNGPYDHRDGWRR